MICGLGEDRNDGVPADPPRFITCGWDRICGADCMLGAWLLMPVFWREPPPLLRPRWAHACGPVETIVASATAAIKTQVFPAYFFSLKAHIEILLSPRRQYY
ncbi:MAG: hypothetical protein ABFE01_05480 [Phycisphaerales bacterium]